MAERAAARHDWIGEAGRPNRDETSGTYRRTADFRVSTTDPDASPMPLGDGRTHLGYQDHYVVDGGKARIVLTALVTPAEVQDNQPALDLLWRARFRWKLQPRQVTGDTKYGTVENIVAIERRAASVRTSPCRRSATSGHVPRARTSLRRGSGRLSLSRRADFALHLPERREPATRSTQAPAAACAACALRAAVHDVASEVGASAAPRRGVSWTGCASYHATEPYAKAMRKRKVWVEPLFAEAKDWHGLRRFRLRGLEKVNGEALLIAAGQNLKRLLSRSGWGRRPWPNGRLGRSSRPSR